VSFPPIFVLSQRKYEKNPSCKKKTTSGSRTDGRTNFINNLLFAIPPPSSPLDQAITFPSQGNRYIYSMLRHNARRGCAATPAATASHRRRQPPSQRRRQSRASYATRFCPLIFCRGGGGVGLRQQRFDPVVHLGAIVFDCSGGRRRPNAAAAVATTTPLTATNRINNQQTMRSGGTGWLRGDDTTRDEDMLKTIKQITRRGG